MPLCQLQARCGRHKGHGTDLGEYSQKVQVFCWDSEVMQHMVSLTPTTGVAA